MSVMKKPIADNRIRPLPHHVAVIGAAGGLGQGILDVCRTEGIGFTAIVRSRPERITNVPRGSRIAVVPSLTDCTLLKEAFSGADAVLTALGVTSTSHDRSALLSANMATVEEAMLASQVDRILMINTLLASKPGRPASRGMRFFSLLPGRIGRGATEQQAVADAIGNGALSSLRWTLVRAGVNAKGKDERPVASADWSGALNSWLPVSYQAMGRWMIEEAAANRFVRAAPLVSRRRGLYEHIRPPATRLNAVTPIPEGRDPSVRPLRILTDKFERIRRSNGSSREQLSAAAGIYLA